MKLDERNIKRIKQVTYTDYSGKLTNDEIDELIDDLLLKYEDLKNDYDDLVNDLNENYTRINRGDYEYGY